MSRKEVIQNLGGDEEDPSAYLMADESNYADKRDHALRSAAHSPQHRKRLKKTLGNSGDYTGEVSFRLSNDGSEPN